MEKSHRHTRKPTGLSRTQIEDICIELKGKYSFGHDDIIKTVSKILVDDITMQDEDCQHVVGLFLTPDIIDKCGAKFIELYRQCYTGGIKDRYALLQISWSEWACACLIGDTPENIAMIPDEISSRQYDEQESCAVFHAICSAFFEATSLIVKDIRPLVIVHSLIKGRSKWTPCCRWYFQVFFFQDVWVLFLDLKFQWSEFNFPSKINSPLVQLMAWS